VSSVDREVVIKINIFRGEHTGFLWENMEERDCYEDLDVNVQIISK
jgi:hypothetical protein